MKFSQYLFVNKPIRFLLVFAVILSVLFSCSERGSDLFEFENEEEEEFEEGEILRGFDLWTEMRAYPNAEINASGFSRAYTQSQAMSIQSRNDDLQMDLPNTADWVNLAPMNFSGRILCVAFHPTNPNIMYVGSASGGLWKTTTGGTGGPNGISWTYIPTGFPVNAVASIAINPKNPNEIYIGTGEVYSIGPLATGTIGHGGAVRTFRGSYGIGILKTTNGGTTWTKSKDFAASNLKGVMDLAIHPNNPDTVFAATTDGIYKTMDAGANWNLIHNVVLANSMAFKPGNPDILYCGSGNFGSTGSGIYRITNVSSATPTFVKLSAGLPTGILGKIEISVTPANSNIIYASIGNLPAPLNGPEGMYKSIDGGDNWTKPNTAAVIGNQGWYGHDIAVSRADANLVLWGELDFYRSTDGGNNVLQVGYWNRWDINNTTVGDISEGTNATYVHADIHSIVSSPHDATGQTFFVCTDGGLFRTTNGGSAYQSLNGGLNTSQIYANAAISATDKDFMVMGLQDNEAFIYAGDSGCRRIGSLGDGFHAAIDPGNDNRSYMESYFLRIDRTTDKWINSGNRIAINTNGSSLAVTDSACFNAPFVLAPSNPTIMYGGTVKMFKFTNVTSASPVKTTMNGGANLSGPSQPILTIGISKTSDQVVYASTVPRYAVRSRIFRTTNGGTSFTEITGTLPDRFYSKIAVDPTNHSRIAITLSGFGSSHVFLSTNSGTNWTDIGTGLPDVPANTLAFDPDNVGVLYVGTDNGVYYAQNVPLSTSATSLTIPWSSYNEGFPDGVMVSDFVFTPKPPLPAQRKIRLATFGRGLWERDLAPYIALPFNTISLEAKRVNQLNEINWKINGEHNVSYYEVEYSANGRDFTSISKLNARNTGEQQAYSYKHNISNNANSYYRIKIVDIDGAVKFSSTELISAENNIPVFKVYPNPTSSSIHVSFTATADQQARYIIYNTAGSRMAVKSLSLMKGAQDISIDVSGFASGSYRIVLEYNGTKKSTTIIKK